MKARKQIIVTLTLLLSLSTTSCKDKLTQFHIDYTSQVVVSSTVGELVPFSLSTPQMETNSEYEFESNNTNKERISGIRLEKLKLTIVSPSNETFSFLNSLEIFISSPNVTERKVAFKESISSNVGDEIECELIDIGLEDYIKEETFKLRLKTVTDETIPEDVTIDVYTDFFVEAKLIK